MEINCHLKQLYTTFMEIMYHFYENYVSLLWKLVVNYGNLWRRDQASGPAAASYQLGLVRVGWGKGTFSSLIRAQESDR